jgi:hypothetical protein
MVGEVIEASRGYLKNKTEQYVAGKITLPEFVTTVLPEIKHSHTAMSVIAHGGKINMGANEFGKLGSNLRFEFQHFRELWLARERGEVSDKQLLARINLYADAPYKTFENSLRAAEIKAGSVTEEMRVLGGGKNCSDCPPLAGVWVPLGSSPGIGEGTACMNQCQCSFEYR